MSIFRNAKKVEPPITKATTIGSVDIETSIRKYDWGTSVEIEMEYFDPYETVTRLSISGLDDLREFHSLIGDLIKQVEEMRAK